VPPVGRSMDWSVQAWREPSSLLIGLTCAASVPTPIDPSPWLIMSRLTDPPTPLFICSSRCRDKNGRLLCPTASPVVASPVAGGTHAACLLLLNPKRLARAAQRAGAGRRDGEGDSGRDKIRLSLPRSRTRRMQACSGSLTRAAQRSHGLASYACLARVLPS
jgi:hypothetical protein